MVGEIFKATEAKCLNPTDWNRSQDHNFFRYFGKTYPAQSNTFESLAVRPMFPGNQVPKNVQSDDLFL